MRVFVYLVFILFVVLAADDSEASISPALIRIRTQKNLSVFPKFSKAFIKKISPNVWVLRGTDLNYKNKQLPHDNFIIKKENENYDIISVLDFNEYLAGVVAHEMPTSWPIEALKAQAVVARSYAISRIRERADKNFHLESDQMDQVFSYTKNAKARLAVELTDGVIVTDTNDQIVKTFFHSDCGGETVNSSEVWGGDLFRSGTTKDPWCADRKSNKWSYEVSRSEFQNKLLLAENDIEQIQYEPKKQLINFGPTVFSVQKLRSIFGFFNIKSALDSLEISGDKIKFTGSGFGHGVGLCQYGTLAQVKLGRVYSEVIQHYYPRAKIARNGQILSLNSTQKDISN